MSYEADQARLLYLVEKTNPYVCGYDDSPDEDEPDNVEVLDINTDSDQELSDSEKDSTVTSEFSNREPCFLGKDGSTQNESGYQEVEITYRHMAILSRVSVSNRTARLTDKIELKALLGLLNLSGNVYAANMEVYVGAQPDRSYNVSNSPSAVVERLCRPISGTKRNLTIDNSFTSKELADSLLKNHKLTVVETLRKKKRQLPSKFV
ncbi:hypothetical protein NQ314_009162 [Rhamnusium bicolor]|uniref:PiggyBac transposable element-derived protein domain-containing protein n=1 Tax=Rhamnusium bicolor TaxID=1586634 RepID=A0AAV8Y2E1_9CUCU|nr:hypothetical protein NQ314_009162 [Rhamnusium bicolor]